MVSTRRSAQSSASGPVQPEGAPSEPAPGGAPPTVPKRRSREYSQPQTPGAARETGDLHTVVLIHDDKALKQPVEVEKHGSKGKDTVVIERLDQMDEGEASLEEPPAWLPDGWIMENHQDDSGSIYRYYTSPASGYTFPSKVETLQYLFSGMDEHFLESKERTEKNGLYRSHTWLPDGWVIEVRAGGKKMDKMYKFYVHLATGKRFLSKGDVLRYANEGKISRCDMDVLCDMSTDDNILAHLEFNPDGLPNGWVKELIFRKCNDALRKDPYYTDPISHHVFRTLRSVLNYLKTGEISRHAYMPRRSVTDMYSFDICTDLPQSLLGRLRVEGPTKRKSRTAPVLDMEANDQTSNHSEGGQSARLRLQSDVKGEKYKAIKGTDRKRANSDTNMSLPERPKIISKQSDEIALDCDMSFHKQTKHIDVKTGMDVTDGEDMPNEKILECAVKEKHTAIFQQTENLVGGNHLTRKQNNQESMISFHLNEQETDKLSKTSRKETCSTVQKFYMRRNRNQALGSKKG